MQPNLVGKLGEDLTRVIFPRANEKPRTSKGIPDFVQGDFWIDSKVAYGSLGKFLHDYERQFKRYMEVFDKGVVIYWRGYSTVAYWAAKERGIRLISGWELMRELEKRGLRRKFMEIAAGKLDGFSPA